jgi:hypothetical protein
MQSNKNIQRLQKRYDQLKSEIMDIGLIQVGTITERIDRRDSPTSPGGKRDYGPYYQWTFKRSGKTVTVNLTKQQAKEHRKAIDNNRKLQNNLIEMRRLSLIILQAETKKASPRKEKA